MSEQQRRSGPESREAGDHHCHGDDDDDEEDDGDDEGDEDEDEECVVRLDKTGRPRIRGDGRGRLIQHQNVSHLLYWFL